MRKPILIILLLLPIIGNIQAQDQDTISNTNTVTKYINFVDSLFIDRNPTHYSLRLFTSYKDRSFLLENGNDEIKYIPNNKSGFGIGFANTKINVDLGINIKSNDDVTDRFDFVTNLTLNRATIGLSIQHYKGYNIESSSLDEQIFRDDISSLSVGISYMRLFNTKQFSMSSIINGVSRQKKNAYSFGFGGALGYKRTAADSSMVALPGVNDFNPYAEITNMKEFGLSALGQINGILVLPLNFFITSSFVPGIGINFKDVETETINYKPNEPFTYTLAIRGAIGFNLKRFYTLLSYDGVYHTSSLGFENRSNLKANKLKWVVGYKLFNEKASSR
jgi:uncharacterized protein DUF4421